ncbi:tetratricopeptide repeat protein [Streptomyces sp. S.PNR 29]|uniref:tetratricopeptide repeat protein n=1 Tax=Streptomyces sp. S.PNR 29 TaxID=2973805 RepID=UPI0025B1B14C|nr:tetratricopeptide repeat protein [Streptomyces sp. S.PNR 29]MDN0193652.1 tetratricopeptide repeat protein [Streptomyces sp. S.PNR 29]
MSRLSREKKREQKHAGHAAAPIDVRVPGSGPGTVGGVPVGAAPGEEIQHAVLNRLHRIALATGHPVLATVHDDRIGYVVPLQVDPDGSSRFTAEPVRTAPPEDAVRPPVPPKPPEPPAPPTGGDKPTHVLRSVPEPARDAAPTFPLRAVPEPQPGGESSPTFRMRAVPEPPEGTPPGTVPPPTGAFGPPPPMDAVPGAGRAHESEAVRRPEPEAVRAFVPDGLHDPDPEPKPTPPRGFDAVAEAVLGDDTPTAPGSDAPALLADPMARVNEAVKAGRIEEAARLAEQTVAQASGALGPEHPEVLRLRELTAYIAYLSGDAVRAFHLSLDLARIRRQAGDAEAAYGNVQSAATAWRAVRDPAQGLDLGRDLIGLWTELTAEDGPAAEDIEQLESARARMGRLTERARARGN